MRGFTTVRDLGGPVFAFKQAVDEGLVVGPRIYPSGGMITTSGGHGDLRPLDEVPRQRGWPAPPSGSAATSWPTVRKSCGCGCARCCCRAPRRSSWSAAAVSALSFQPDQILAIFTEAELRAAVDAATDWGTYVTPMPTHHRPCVGRSQPGSSASNTAS